LLLAACPPPRSTAEVVATQKIWDKSAHQGFTDLVRFQNLFYCCFREGETATQGGTIRLMISASGETWIDHITLSEPGVDLRDPKLVVTPDNKRLYLICAGVLRRWRPPVPLLHQPRWQGVDALSEAPRQR
jgi:hypothetical protein